MKMHSEHTHKLMFFQKMDSCCQKIAESIGDKPISEWTNGDYVKLSGLVSRKTKIYISESTLKRIFGKSKTSVRYYPQKATRDALAQFIGYRDWYEFEFLHTSTPVQDVSPKSVQSENKSAIKSNKTKSWLLVSVFSVIASILILIVYRYAGSGKVSVRYAELLSLNSEGISPHSAFFKLSFKGGQPVAGKELSIDFGDGRKSLHFKDSVVSHYYEVPGRYYPMLYDNGNVLDTGVVYLQTKGWTATGFNEHDTTRVYPVPIRSTKVEELVKVSSSEAFHAGIDTTRTFFISFANIRPTNISGDNLNLSMHIVSSSLRPGVRCSQADITIYGEKDSHKIGLIKPECVFWTAYKFSEIYKDGKKQDLRALGNDLSKGADLRLSIKNKKPRLFINNQLIFSAQYKKPIGRVMGLSVTFSGLGKFENVQLSDLITKEKFSGQ